MITSSVFFTGIARIRWACSRQDGSRYSRKRKNVLIAASREFRVLAQFPRFFSRCSRNASTNVASSCSIESPAGDRLYVADYAGTVTVLAVDAAATPATALTSDGDAPTTPHPWAAFADLLALEPTSA